MPINSNSDISVWLKKITQRIRIYTDSAPGFGNQAASANLVGYLREKGYSGIIEFIYPASITEKITALFGLPDKIPTVYSQSDNMIFYTIDELLKRFQQGTLEPTTVAMTGGMDIPKDVRRELGILGVEHSKDIMFNLEGFQRDESVIFNYANLLNAETFIAFSQYQGIANPMSHNTQIHVRDKVLPVVQEDTNGKFIIAPHTDFAQAEDYVASAKGEALLKKQPGLKALMHAYKNESVNLIPSYGYPLDRGENSILEIVSGARYAQLKSAANKPIIMPVFYNFNAAGLKRINDVVIAADKNNKRIAAENLDLQNAFKIASLSENGIADKIQNLKAGEILLVATGELPKTVFNAMHAYNGANVLMQVREGASSLSSLLQSGRPHLRCGGQWELGTDKITDISLRQQMLDLGLGICNSESDWDTRPVHQLIGEYIIAAQQSDSSLSQYFKDLQRLVKDPMNDRIAFGLHGAMDLSSVLSNVISSSSTVVAGLIATSLTGLINDVNSNTALLAAPEEVDVNESAVSLLTSNEPMDMQTWLKIAAVSVTVTLALVVLARSVNWSEKFNYCKQTLAHTLFGSRPQPQVEIDIESQNAQTLRVMSSAYKSE